MSSDGSLNVRDFGAVGDGASDDTAAIQKALDAAGERGAIVTVPAGVYAVGSLKLHPHTGLAGDATWSYREFGGSVLTLADPDAACLLDLTGATGATLTGLSLDGGGRNMEFANAACGVMIDKDDYGSEEDVPRIERCRIGGFGGDGVRFNRIWCWSVRHSMVCHNGGAGLRVRGWDGFLLDTWLSGNAGCGFAATDENASNTISACRIEWNRRGGIHIVGGNNVSITGNYIDRSGGCGIRIEGRDGAPSECMTVTGNVIYRSGRPGWRFLDDHESAHIWCQDARALTITGNAMRVGQDDGGKGDFSPRFGIVYQRLSYSIIKNNVLADGALEKLIVDLHDHGQVIEVSDNVGCLYAENGSG